MNAQANKTKTVLCWPGRLLAEDDLRRHWTSQGEILLGRKTIVTPLAMDWLKSRRVTIRRDDAASDTPVSSNDTTIWAYAEETPSPLVAAVVRALLRDGKTLPALESAKGDSIRWARTIAEGIEKGQPAGAVLFCEQPGLAVCVANKISGVRAAIVSQPAQVGPLRKALGPNVFAIAAAERTFFELRQLLKLTTDVAPMCPENLANTLRELDGHAHR